MVRSGGRRKRRRRLGGHGVRLEPWQAGRQGGEFLEEGMERPLRGWMPLFVVGWQDYHMLSFSQGLISLSLLVTEDTDACIACHQKNYSA